MNKQPNAAARCHVERTGRRRLARQALRSPGGSGARNWPTVWMAKLAKALDILARHRPGGGHRHWVKSGHIARKIAPPPSPLPAPGPVLHPAEAQPWRSRHGDGKDTVLASLIRQNRRTVRRHRQPYRRWSIPLISITMQRGRLGNAADPDLARYRRPVRWFRRRPSTTMMLALGDALAVALLERKGFHARRFPGIPGGPAGRCCCGSAT